MHEILKAAKKLHSKKVKLPAMPKSSGFLANCYQSLGSENSVSCITESRADICILI